MSSFFSKIAVAVAIVLGFVFVFSKLELVIRWTPQQVQDTVNVTFVSCGNGIDESVVMMKSIIMFSKSRIIFHIFTELDYMKQYENVLLSWPEDVRDRIVFDIREVSFPEIEDGDVGEWMKLCKPCSSQRLFIHLLLPEVDSVLYVDTDTLFLHPVEELWHLLKRFNQYQLAGLSLDQERGEPSFYERHPEIPHYGAKGLNSGVMLMNLTRIRSSSWLQEIVANYGKYKTILLLGDQDLLNIYFHRFPELLYVSPCEWNYRAEHCNMTSTCKQAEATGAKLMHGMNEKWFTDDQPAFKATYETFMKHPLTTPSTVSLLSALYDNIKSAPPSNCGQIMEKFYWYMFNDVIDEYSVFVSK